jgi:hypothetical protein
VISGSEDVSEMASGGTAGAGSGGGVPTGGPPPLRRRVRVGWAASAAAGNEKCGDSGAGGDIGGDGGTEGGGEPGGCGGAGEVSIALGASCETGFASTGSSEVELESSSLQCRDASDIPLDDRESGVCDDGGYMFARIPDNVRTL